MRVLAISAHPDDETLGCGGTLLRHGAAGDELHWLIATQGTEPQWSRETLSRKTDEIRAVGEAYGMKSTHRLGFNAAALDTAAIGDVIRAVRGVLDNVRPEVVYVVHPGDVHTDHHALFTATLSAAKAFYMRELGVREILAFETLSSTDAAPQQVGRSFVPNVFRDITPHLERKIEIMNLFGSELHADPYPRGASSIRALARHRGATIATEYAEAFVLVRRVD